MQQERSTSLVPGAEIPPTPPAPIGTTIAVRIITQAITLNENKNKIQVITIKWTHRLHSHPKLWAGHATVQTILKSPEEVE